VKDKLLKIRIKQCALLSEASPCPRRSVGAIIIDPRDGVVLSDGYNGTPRGSKDSLCGGDVCLRDSTSVVSGTQNDVGCHHAEMNAILNSSRRGQATLGKWMIVSCSPCLMCAKAIHHAGITRVIISSVPDSHTDGISYLESNGVLVSIMLL
jgi:dCMP deaminase